MLKLQSTSLSPFWLGLSHLLRKISATSRSQSEEAVLSSGTVGMKHVQIRDEKRNYMVFKRNKKQQNSGKGLGED